MRGGPQVIWNRRRVAHRPSRSDRAIGLCGAPGDGGEGTLLQALRAGVRPCRQRACDLVALASAFVSDKRCECGGNQDAA